MDLAAMATPADYRKLEFLKRSFANLLEELEMGDFLPRARRDARPVLRAASRACVYDGESGPIVRQYYAVTGDFSRVWFTLDLFSIMPDCIRTRSDIREVKFIFKQIAGLLIGEVRQDLRDELKI